MDKTLYLVRHCSACGQGPEDGLTEQGQRQAQVLAHWLAARSVDRIVSSPYARARASIAPFAQLRNLPVEIEGRLSERVLSSGPLPDWQQHLARSFAELDLCLPGGESSRRAMERGASVLEEVLDHEATTTVLVTHGNLLTLLLRHLGEEVGFAEWERMSSPDVYCVTISSAPIVVERWLEDSAGTAS